ncbi:MAG: hypothetical protein JW928_04825 [Candidatus Aureabacteria bacterium]|nr:hypothetical protein [Candidatus Auribacterota bacterium]
MRESRSFQILKIIFIIFFLVFIVYFLKSGYYKAVRIKHDMPGARAVCDRFMLFLSEDDPDKAYNLFYSPAKQLGKRDEFRESVRESFEEFGPFREIFFIASYPQPSGPYLGMHYKAVHEDIMAVDYFFLLLKEDEGYSIYQFVYGESGTFYPEFSFKKEQKDQPVIIYQAKPFS